jgi:hypothetical protein
MNAQQDQPGMAFGWIILLVILCILFNSIPGPVDDAAVAAIAGYHALKRLQVGLSAVYAENRHSPQ